MRTHGTGAGRPKRWNRPGSIGDAPIMACSGRLIDSSKRVSFFLFDFFELQPAQSHFVKWSDPIPRELLEFDCS
jgi:hypothetical protein